MSESAQAHPGWHASLSLQYAIEQGRTVARHRHEGPLRILKSLYPEGDAICHNVLVHPPSGLVGGDTLAMQIEAGEGTHALVTTPGATRFYRSEGAEAAQTLHARLAPGARLEWLPLEALAYPGCNALNRALFELAPEAELLAWDITALGLPQADRPFEHGRPAGRFRQHLEIPGVWLERGVIAADDGLLLDGALGLAGQRCLATLVFAAGAPLARERRERALDAVRSLIDGHALRSLAGATAAHEQVLVLRCLAPLVEPAAGLLRACWAAWRRELWGLAAVPPRTWAL